MKQKQEKSTLVAGRILAVLFFVALGWSCSTDNSLVPIPNQPGNGNVQDSTSTATTDTTSTSTSGSTTTPTSGYVTFQDAMLAEINLARTQPVKYATQRLTGEYNSGTDNGAYNDLISLSAVSALTLNDLLTTSATKYAKYMADNNVFGHTENGTPQSRAQAEGYTGSVGENIAAGSYPSYNADSDPNGAAIAFVKLLIIDTGISGVGHRKNILSSSYKVVGIGFYQNTASKFDNYLVQDFGTK